MPSDEHERRVAALSVLGVMSGCSDPVSLGSFLRPDVVLAHCRHPVLFVGDAKDTESVGNQATARRVRRYLRVLRSLMRGGLRVRLTLCGPPTGGAWERRLVALALQVEVPVAGHGHSRLGRDELSWIDLRYPRNPL